MSHNDSGCGRRGCSTTEAPPTPVAATSLTHHVVPSRPRPAGHYATAEVAAIARVSRERVLQARNEGKLTAIEVDGRLWLEANSVVLWLLSRTRRNRL